MSKFLNFRFLRASRSTKLALALALTLISLTSGLFIAAPEIDIEFSALFYDGGKFRLAENSSLQLLRDANEWIAAFVLGLAIILLCSSSLRSRIGLRFGDALLPIVTYGIGVGLIVNVFFKEYFGRARPRDILEFGGDRVFTTVWEISDACQSNCSFTSGEAAAAVAIYSAMVMLPGLNSTMRFACGIFIGLLAILLSVNRIAFGAHFLSDVLLSMLIVLVVMLIARLLLNWAATEIVRSRRASAA